MLRASYRQAVYGISKDGLLHLTRTLAGALVPLGREATYEEIARGLAFLASEDASSMTGWAWWSMVVCSPSGRASRGLTTERPRRQRATA